MTLKQYLVSAILKRFSTQPTPYEFKKYSLRKLCESTPELTPVLEEGTATPLSRLQATRSCHFLWHLLLSQ